MTKYYEAKYTFVSEATMPFQQKYGFSLGEGSNLELLENILMLIFLFIRNYNFAYYDLIHFNKTNITQI